MTSPQLEFAWTADGSTTNMSGVSECLSQSLVPRTSSSSSSNNNHYQLQESLHKNLSSLCTKTLHTHNKPFWFNHGGRPPPPIPTAVATLVVVALFPLDDDDDDDDMGICSHNDNKNVSIVVFPSTRVVVVEAKAK